MRRVPVALPLLLVTTVMGCHPASDSGAANDPLSPPGLGAEASRSNVDFFFGNDFDRDISFTVGLVSPVADLDDNPDCGGSGPRLVDGGIENLVFTPAGSVHVRDRWHKATFVLYAGATNDVCELPSRPVLAGGLVNFSVAARVPDIAEAGISIHFHMEGIVDLTSGGKARALITANYFFDNDGNGHIHVDRFELKPIRG